MRIVSFVLTCYDGA